MRHQLNGESQDSKTSASYQLGAGVIYPLNKSYYKDKDGSEITGLYPSLQYIRKGIKKTTLIDPINSDIKLNELQLTVPFYTQAGSFGLGFGPYATLSLSGKAKYTAVTGGERKINFGSGSTNDLKALDYGLSLHFNISVFYFQYDYGFANLGSGKFGSAKNRNFNFGLFIPLVDRYE